MAIVISAGAGLVLGHLGVSMTDLSGRDIPRLAASLQLAAQSASLAGQGPGLLASRTEEALNERARKMKETQQVAVERLGRIIELGADKTVVAALGETVKNIDDAIKSLGAAARERLEAAAQHETLYHALRKAQAGFVAAAGPALIDAHTELNSIFAAPNFSQDDATKAQRTADQLGEIVPGAERDDAERRAGGAVRGGRLAEEPVHGLVDRAVAAGHEDALGARA